MCNFLGVDCKYSVKTCQGVKVCELIGNQITSSTHQEVDVERDFSIISNSVSAQQQTIISTQMYVVVFIKKYFLFQLIKITDFNSDLTISYLYNFL